jgi:hypothetical protein
MNGEHPVSKAILRRIPEETCWPVISANGGTLASADPHTRTVQRWSAETLELKAEPAAFGQGSEQESRALKRFRE